MLAFPLQNRNKVDDSKVEDEVLHLVEHNNESTRTLAQRLIDHWATFSSAYRIPKRLDSDVCQKVFGIISSVENFC
jgi:[histone H3]-lysine36 N-trimethyltransferase